jgi:hypothetical protein
VNVTESAGRGAIGETARARDGCRRFDRHPQNQALKIARPESEKHFFWFSECLLLHPPGAGFMMVLMVVMVVVTIASLWMVILEYEVIGECLGLVIWNRNGKLISSRMNPWRT